MVFQTDAELKGAYAERLRQAGKGVSVDVPMGEHGGTIDILTEREIIFCTVELDRTRALLAKSKLDFISRFSPSWQRVVVVQTVVDPSALSLLTEAGIQVVALAIESTVGSSVGSTEDVLANSSASPKNSTVPPQTPSKQVTFDRELLYAYPALDSVEGGDGLRAALMVIGLVLLVGGFGAAIALVRSQEQPSSGFSFPMSASLIPANVSWQGIACCYGEQLAELL